MCFSDEANFAYIIEAVQVKKPGASSEVKSSIAASRNPPPGLACGISSDTTNEDVQSVKELFPHLEACHIEVFMIDIVLCFCNTSFRN